jgi:hypothetical protein
MALTGSQMKPTAHLGFSNGTIDEADGTLSEPRFLLSGRLDRQSFLCAHLFGARSISGGIVPNRRRLDRALGFSSEKLVDV